jgi:hypothetical protein
VNERAFALGSAQAITLAVLLAKRQIAHEHIDRGGSERQRRRIGTQQAQRGSGVGRGVRVGACAIELSSVLVASDEECVWLGVCDLKEQTSVACARSGVNERV